MPIITLFISLLAAFINNNRSKALLYGLKESISFILIEAWLLISNNIVFILLISLYY